ncbi:MAG: hypothetical protein PHV30_11895 [Candidatus Margulisbacteria bacterium]|nr:hypothetical protein [Candidatus Margulisiibacteriota bacterium]
MAYYQELSQQEWNNHSKYQQIMMIGTDLSKAKARIMETTFNDARQFYFRAIELVDLLINDPKWKAGIKEVLRFKEELAKGALFLCDNLYFNVELIRVLYTWNSETLAIRDFLSF